MKPKTHTYLCAWDRTEQRKTRVKPLFAKFNQLEGNFKGNQLHELKLLII
ncbi:hypothetical protein Hanom_Chr17g01529361 [Helianthus anomalus]|nr:hypothetical protein HanIR_Chr17g0865271 [Helianthus annuus]